MVPGFVDIAFAIGITLALSIGANNSGVNMAPAFGAGARGRWSALLLFAIFAGLGAILLGPRTLEAVGNGLFTQRIRDTSVLVILGPGIALSVITLAVLLRLPFPTTPAAISALMGVGLYYGVLNTTKVWTILAWWIASPLAALTVNYLIGILLLRKFPHLLDASKLSPRARKWIGTLLTVEGCYAAFAVGANNTANAFAPLVGAKLVTVPVATLLAAAAFAAGALFWGGGVLRTVGKRITDLCYVRALVVGATGATGMLVASLYAVPVSGTLIITGGILGFSLATAGVRSTSENRQVRRTLLLWVTGPAWALSTGYFLTWMLT